MIETFVLIAVALLGILLGYQIAKIRDQNRTNATVKFANTARIQYIEALDRLKDMTPTAKLGEAYDEGFTDGYNAAETDVEEALED